MICNIYEKEGLKRHRLPHSYDIYIAKKYYLTYCINILAVLQALKRNPSSSDDDGIRTINDVASSQNVYGTKVPFHWNFLYLLDKKSSQNYFIHQMFKILC